MFLNTELATLEKLAPGLRSELAAHPLSTLEARGGPGLAAFARAGGPRLLVPARVGGRGASALQAVRFQRGLGALAPAVAVGTTMHQYKIATLVHFFEGSEGDQLLGTIAANDWLVASGGAEGQTGQNLFAPGVRATKVAGGLRVSGSKKPCCLAFSMGMLSMLIGAPSSDGKPAALINVLVPAASEGIRAREFSKSPVLAAAECDEVVLEHVFVPDANVFPVGSVETGSRFTIGAFVWFELLATAAYLGVAGGLVRRALEHTRAGVGDLAGLVAELDSAACALDELARRVDDGLVDSDTLAKSLCVRYATEGAIERISNTALRLLGGVSFLTNPDVSYLLAACRGLAFHPPNLQGMADSLVGYFREGTLRLG